MASTPQNREVFSVTDLNRSARRLLEGEFPMIFVEGEISNLAKPSSGHWYFTLKDEKAQIRCAMFRNRNQAIRFNPTNGNQIVVRGKISLYEGRGEFQLIVEFMEEAGDGALRRAFEKLKNQLEAEGLFAEQHKQTIPAMPKHIGVITSPTGAAVRDVLQVLNRRFPGIEVSIIPVAVQGEDSPRQIVAAIEMANHYYHWSRAAENNSQPMDLLLVTRGGGSLEDLWSFNTEPVARAIFASEIPIISAVGHETDTSIADFVADLRAPTPSAAAELISPDQQEWLQTFVRYEHVLTNMFQNQLASKVKNLEHLRRRLRHPGQRLQDLSQKLDELELRQRRAFERYVGQFQFDATRSRLNQAMQRALERANSKLTITSARLDSPERKILDLKSKLDQLNAKLSASSTSQLEQLKSRFVNATGKLNTLSPLSTLERGYAIVSQPPGDLAVAGETNKIIRDASTLTEGDEIHARLMLGSFKARVTSIDET
jgi:exodeoxyribonuclease VII large subunit